jgi:uncharacterized membrane protein
MNFHKKTLITYIAANLVMIVLGYLQLYAVEPTLTTDRELALNGVSKTVWPVMSLLITGLIVVAAYAIRGLWMLGRWCFRRVA